MSSDYLHLCTEGTSVPFEATLCHEMIINVPVPSGMLQTITEMKHYKNTEISLEELRLKDYCLGKGALSVRKGYELKQLLLTCTRPPSLFDSPYMPEIKPGNSQYASGVHPFRNITFTLSSSSVPRYTPNRDPSKRGCSKVICSRSGYYTLPSLEILDSLTDTEKETCIVESFTVGRINFGKITFLEPVNVYGINLDEIVHLTDTGIIIYPDETRMPKAGSGLNAQAEITLDFAFPIDSEKQCVIKDPATIQSLGFAENLKESCIKEGAEFISYDETDGILVFRVQHFSNKIDSPDMQGQDKDESDDSPDKKRQRMMDENATQSTKAAEV